jgi:hypothetical protein
MGRELGLSASAGELRSDFWIVERANMGLQGRIRPARNSVYCLSRAGS